MSAKRRRVEGGRMAGGTGVSTPVAMARTRGGIAAFTRTTKAIAQSKDVLQKSVVLDSTIDIPISPIALGGKRKLDTTNVTDINIDIETDNNTNVAAAILNSTAATSTTPKTEPRPARAIRPLPARRCTVPPKTPHRQTKEISSPIPTPGSVQTPTNGLRGALDKFFLPRSPASQDVCDESEAPVASSQTSLGSSQQQGLDQQVELPGELQDLINLFSSFLTALTLHYAHNGTHTPCDLRVLSPNIARVWGKRAVSLLDIKRLLGVLNYHVPTLSQSQSSSQGQEEKELPRLSLSDYGRGKICIEIRTTGRQGRIAKPLDENALNTLFSSNLAALWAEKEEVTDTEAFVAGLETEEIRQCASLSKMSPLLAKGQRRLEDMRGITVKKPSSPLSTDTKSPSKPSSDTSTTPPPKLSLLDRLRLKSATASSLPPPPSKATLARKAALNRVPEIASILALLSTGSSKGQSRVSFTLPTVVGKVRDSVQSAVSRGEVEDAVRCLAEVAGEWVQLVKRGGRGGEAVVVCTESRPEEEVVEERVRRALEGCT